jgi:hypothetical protein
MRATSAGKMPLAINFTSDEICLIRWFRNIEPELKLTFFEMAESLSQDNNHGKPALRMISGGKPFEAR